MTDNSNTIDMEKAHFLDAIKRSIFNDASGFISGLINNGYTELLAYPVDKSEMFDFIQSMDSSNQLNKLSMLMMAIQTVLEIDVYWADGTVKVGNRCLAYCDTYQSKLRAQLWCMLMYISDHRHNLPDIKPQQI